MKTAFATFALAATTALAVPAFAQMSDGRGQLETVASQALAEAGIVYPVEELSVAQLTEIKTLSTTDEGDISTELYTILGMEDPEAVTMDTPDRSQLELAVQQKLDAAGVDADATTLSNEQLTAIFAMVEDENSDMTQQIESIVKG